MNKKELRKMIKEKLNQELNHINYIEKSSMIKTLLFKEEDWLTSNTIGITISNFPEPDTREIIEKAWELGKKVVVPKCIPSDKSLQFRELNSFSQLETVYFGLKEPKVNETRLVSRDEINLLFVPGLSFSLDGYRLGHGGGYYDRFLTLYKGKTISLAFEAQLMSHLPTEIHDLPVSKIVTPQEVIYCD